MTSAVPRRPPSTAFFPVLFSVLFVLAAALAFSAFRGWRAVPRRTTRTIGLDSIREFHAIEVLSRTASRLTMRYALRHNPYFVIPLQGRVQHTKVHLSFGRLEKIRQIRIYLGFEGQPYTRSRFIALPVGKAGALRHEYNALLPDGDYDTLRIDFESGEHYGTAVLRAVSLHPAGWRDKSIWVYAIAVILALFILLPGMLLYSLIHGEHAPDNTFQVLFMAYSVGFYLSAYLIWLLWYRLHLPHPDLAVCGFIFLGLPLLTTLNVFFRRQAAFVSRLRETRSALAGYILLLLGVCFLIVHNANLPLENTWYTSIAGPKTFNAFHAHDAVFQYVNGVAISNGEAFEKYYGNHQLIYDVADRGMLPGVIYAVWRVMLRNFSQLLASSYLVYTMIGAGFNLLVLFPALAFARRYTGLSSRLLFMAAFSLNAFILVNYYLTWYKMAGAAFFLGGLYLMMRGSLRLADWGLSGMLLGIGANMHAGSALGIPLFFLLAVWRQLKDHRLAWTRCISAAGLLVLVFAAANLPWSMVKHFYLHENYTLIKEHFLAGYSAPAGLGKSAELFFEKIPLSQQLPQRIERLAHSLRLAEIRELVRTFARHHAKRGLLLWDQYEFNYAAFVLYPLAFLALLARVLPHKKQVPPNSPAAEGAGSLCSAATLIAVSVATLVAVILLSYGIHPPDITYHLPMGVLVLIDALLIGLVMHGSRYVRIAGCGYYVLTAFRLFMFL